MDKGDRFDPVPSDGDRSGIAVAAGTRGVCFPISHQISRRDDNFGTYTALGLAEATYTVRFNEKSQAKRGDSRN